MVDLHISFTHLLVWVVVGGVAGWLASLVVRGNGLGLLGDIVVGILGGLLGGFVVNHLGGQGITGFNLWTFVVAFAGAAALLLISRLIMSGRSVRHG